MCIEKFTLFALLHIWTNQPILPDIFLKNWSIQERYCLLNTFLNHWRWLLVTSIIPSSADNCFWHHDNSHLWIMWIVNYSRSTPKVKWIESKIFSSHLSQGKFSAWITVTVLTCETMHAHPSEELFDYYCLLSVMGCVCKTYLSYIYI